jgi:hydrogenase nickel incorporation protein HypB
MRTQGTSACGSGLGDAYDPGDIDAGVDGSAALTSAAALNRELLRRAGVLAVSVLGGPGCGKTALIDATIDRLAPDLTVVGVIACDSAAGTDAGMRSRYAQRVVRMPSGDDGGADAQGLRNALRRVDLRRPGVLFVEDDAPAAPPERHDIGQGATAVVYSVASGHRVAAGRPDLVRAADAVILNKIDLIASVHFDLHAFRAEVRRLNPRAVIFELSAMTSRGVSPWIGWLQSQAAGVAAQGAALSRPASPRPAGHPRNGTPS